MKTITIALGAALLSAGTFAAQDIKLPSRTPTVKPSTPTGAELGQDQGMTSPLHAQNVGRLVFTRTNLELGQINAAAFADSFNLGDPIYFRAFMKQSSARAVAPMMAGQNGNYAHRIRYKMMFHIAGAAPIATSIRAWGVPAEHKSWTTWRGLLLDRSGAKNPGADAFREFLSRAMAKGLLKPGAHRIEIDLVPTVANGDQPAIVGPVVAKGALTLNVAAGAVKPGDPQICMPAGAMRDAALEATILNRARATWTDRATRPERVSITHNGWTLYRHPVSGIVTRRAIDARIVARGAEYCTYRGYAYSQASVGGRFDAQGEFSGAEEYTNYLPCGCL